MIGGAFHHSLAQTWFAMRALTCQVWGKHPSENCLFDTVAPGRAIIPCLRQAGMIEASIHAA